MKLPQATWPRPPRTESAQQAAFVFAGILIGMTVLQLFSLEKFVPLLESWHFPGVSGRTLAVTLVVAGVAALPFLLRMKLSIGMRWVSMLAGWLVAVTWLLISLWQAFETTEGVNAGILGASIEVIPGIWLVFVSIGLILLAAWSAWGLWPSRKSPVLEHHREK